MLNSSIDIFYILLNFKKIIILPILFLKHHLINQNNQISIKNKKYIF